MPAKKKPRLPRGKALKQVTAFCMLGATDAQIADFLGVPTHYVGMWMKSDERFRDAVKAGKTIADAEIAKSLYRRAMGFENCTTREQKAVVVDKSRVEVVTLEREHPPDTSAIGKWLNNRQRDTWGGEGGHRQLNALLDLMGLLQEYARRHGADAAKAVAGHHGYQGVLIEGESRPAEQDPQLEADQAADDEGAQAHG